MPRRSRPSTLPAVANTVATPLPTGYAEFLSSVTERIRAAQRRVAATLVHELVSVYWDLGRDVVERQERDGWGSAVIERLAIDLRAAFPGTRGFATRNIWYARAFYLAYTRGKEILQQPVAELDHSTLPAPLARIPWGHNLLLLEKLSHPETRLWYAQRTVEQGWSRAELRHQISTQLHTRSGLIDQASSFSHTLPPDQSNLAREILKDPYNFDFLTVGSGAHERAVESALVQHIRQFLLELGVGFLFAGNQYRLVVGNEEFYIDLLFYHHRLRCFVIIELKSGAFKPEYVGKLGFYLTAVDELLRHPDDRPSIGLILCQSKNMVVAEYAMRDTRRPIGVAEYRVPDALPDDLAASLPSREVLEAELRSVPLTEDER